jgi:molybdenum cofactor cytidylyltransferase
LTVETAIDGVLLAAGSSSRFGPGVAKQLAELGGEPLVLRAALALVRSRLRRVIVVTGSHDAEVRRVLEGLEVLVVHNPSWEEGQSTSVRAGLLSVGRSADGVCFSPCDQPFLDTTTVDLLVSSFDPDLRPIVVPACGGRRGAPVLFSRRFFEELLVIEGDRGGREVLSKHVDLVSEVELGSEKALLDVDTMDELDRLRRFL